MPGQFHKPRPLLRSWHRVLPLREPQVVSSAAAQATGTTCTTMTPDPWHLVPSPWSLPPLHHHHSTFPHYTIAVIPCAITSSPWSLLPLHHHHSHFRHYIITMVTSAITSSQWSLDFCHLTSAAHHHHGHFCHYIITMVTSPSALSRTMATSPIPSLPRASVHVHVHTPPACHCHFTRTL